MPANLTPQYREAEQRFRVAVATEDKIEALEEMIRLLPKHKGTDHLHADLKRRLSKLRTGKGQKRGATRQKSPYHIRPSGAGQAVLVGLPNAGKSAIVSALTNKEVEVAPYPFTTHLPIPAMMPHENAQIELIDTPPVTADHFDPELAALIRRARLCIPVVSLADDQVLEAIDVITRALEMKKTLLAHAGVAMPDENAAGAVHVRTLVAATHADHPEARENREFLEEQVGGRFPMLAVDTGNAGDVSRLRRAIWDALGMIRIYSQPRGKNADRSSPFYLERGGTLLTFAQKLHQDFAQNLKSARVWGSAQYDGQCVKADHVLEDEDVVELSI